jgi:prepilin-type processing-associated H-X9-DG protein
MKLNSTFTRKDIIVLFGCIVFILTNIGAIGSGGRRRAKEMVCLSNLRQWGVIFEMFTNDNDGYFNRGWDVGETDLWMNALRPYYNDKWKLLVCPEAARVPKNSTDSGIFNAWYRNTRLPTGGSHTYMGSYNINSWTNNMTYDRGRRLEVMFWKKVWDIEVKNNIPIFGDGTWHDAWPLTTDSPSPNPGAFGIGNQGTSGEINHFCIDRHNGAVNMLFMDWSVRKVGLKELWTLKWHKMFDTEGPWTIAGGVWQSDWPEWMRNFKDF